MYMYIYIYIYICISLEFSFSYVVRRSLAWHRRSGLNSLRRQWPLNALINLLSVSTERNLGAWFYLYCSLSQWIMVISRTVRTEILSPRKRVSLRGIWCLCNCKYMHRKNLIELSQMRAVWSAESSHEFRSVTRFPRPVCFVSKENESSNRYSRGTRIDGK